MNVTVDKNIANGSSAIDFSALSDATMQINPFKIMQQATGIILTILVIAGLGAIFSSSRNRENVMAVIGVFGVLVLFCAALRATLSMFTKLKKQRIEMEAFAQRNGWQFDGTKQPVPLDQVPAELHAFVSGGMQRFSISGSHCGVDFVLSNILESSRRYSPNPMMTIVRTEKKSNVHGSAMQAGIEFFNDAMYDYYVLGGNVLSRSEVQRMFGAAGII